MHKDPGRASLNAADRPRVQVSDAALRTLIEALPAAVLAVDGEGRIVLVNATAESMFGYNRDELIGRKIETLIPERFTRRHLGHVPSFLRQPSMRPMGAGLELFALRKDGSEFPVDIGLSYLNTEVGLLGVSFVTDISERKNNQKELQALTARLLGVQEGGNKELSRELHDGLSQKLAALGMEVSMLFTRRAKPDDELRKKVRSLSQTINTLAGEVHAMSRRLHPAILTELGLEAAIREECVRFAVQEGVPVQFKAERVPAPLPEDVSLCLYRVAQESLNNVAKHAKAAKVRVWLSGTKNGVTLRVEDTGGGFHLKQVRSKGGLGLISMEERARLVNGRYSVLSQPGKGTTVELFAPLERNGDEAA
jgi:PAS domain S-box-containing protein